MPPVDHGRSYPAQGPDRPTTTSADWPPPLLDPAMLAELPVPLQMMVATALLPYELAMTSVRIMKNTEALLAEMVFHLNALRPAVASVSQAYADGQFNQVFRTIDQIQSGTNAFALVFAPLTAVRDRFVPGTTVTVPPPPPAPAWAPAPRQAPPMRRAAPMAITPAPPLPPPSTAEFLGRLGGKAWEQASTLPGAGLWRKAGRPFAQVWPTAPGPAPAPVVVEEVETFSPVYDDLPEAGTGPASYSLMSLAEPLVPGPVRRLFGGS